MFQMEVRIFGQDYEVTSLSTFYLFESEITMPRINRINKRIKKAKNPYV